MLNSPGYSQSVGIPFAVIPGQAAGIAVPYVGYSCLSLSTTLICCSSRSSLQGVKSSVVAVHHIMLNSPGYS